MRMLNFAKRNFKELIRDPLSLVFEIVLPIFLLFIFQQIKVPGEEYKLVNFTPGIIIFGFSFITLFTATLVAKDRGSSLLIRLGTSPMKSSDYILGYIVSLLPIVLIQIVLFFAVAIIMGLKITVSIIPTILVSMIISVLFIALGILIGSLVSEKATGGLGSIVVQLVCFTSGMYFPKDMIGGVFAVICKALPFEGCLNVIQAVLHNDFSNVTLAHIVVLLIYYVVVILLSIVIFKKRMISDNK